MESKMITYYSLLILFKGYMMYFNKCITNNIVNILIKTKNT